MNKKKRSTRPTFTTLFLLTVFAWICGLITGLPGEAPQHTSSFSTPSAKVGVTTGMTRDPIDLGWLTAAKESVILVATPRGHGSGFCYLRDMDYAFIVTAKHVVVDELGQDIGAYSLMGSANGSMDWSLQAELLSKSSSWDAAIVKAYDPYGIIKTARLAQTVPPKGELVIAMGFPSNHYPVVVTVGFSKGWVVWDAVYFNHSASIWFGNSGGPVFNSKGEVVGINVRINFVNGHPDSGDCGAVPIEDLLMVMKR